MRLFLHGRSGTPMLLKRLEDAREKDIGCNGVSLPSMAMETAMKTFPVSVLSSSSSSLSSSSSSSMTTSKKSPIRSYYSSILLSSWNMDEMDDEVVIALDSFLRKEQPQRRMQQRRRRNKQPCDEIRTTILSSRLSDSSLFAQLSQQEGEEYEQQQQKPKNDGDEQQQREVILHNCTGRERLQELIILLMDTNSSIVIRYDKQRTFPIHIARGLQLGADTIFGNDKDNDFCQLRSLALKGMTITPMTANYLHMALPLLPNLKELTIQGKFTLNRLDYEETSIAGRVGSKSMGRVVEVLHDILQELPQLKVLDLQRCHLPDEYLAYILEGLYHSIAGSVETLRLNGNMAHDISQGVLCCQILSGMNCQLQHLDLSWQRLPFAKRNHSILDVVTLSRVLVNNNTTLKTLDLSENRLLDGDVAELAVAVSRHPTLRSIRLQNCRMTNRGLTTLAQVLPKCSENLKYMFLDGTNKITDAPLVRRAFFQALLKNFYLRELVLPDCCESTSIEWVVELNRAGRRALLVPDERDILDPAIECTIFSAPSFDSQNSTNQLPDALWPTIIERADRITRREYLDEMESSTKKAASAIYLLLREKGFQSIIR